MLGKFNLFYYLISLKTYYNKEECTMASAASIAKQGKNVPGAVANTGAKQRATTVALNGRGGNYAGASRGRVNALRRTRG